MSGKNEIKKTILSEKKTSRQLNFGETFMFVGCREENSVTKFIMDFAKVIKIFRVWA